ncbi:hypothetical protein [Photobacterium chitinilyticum]|uniref:Lipoprotein n=1 Tax=Photobacterium chitinilyticum TaxID=2485123 RepID=A0A444JM61_9GAMM|nr:hypothetical protein [Photobacterium chitinilyticum]RWX54184.1 hypothetical protein EDI28_18300 [Photobacterium chitinilyticum]
MKFRIASLAIATTLLSGCMTTKLVPPPSDFVGNLPDEYKAKLNTLNDQPSTPFRGGVQTFQFDEAASLLTVVYRLPNPRWYWNIRKSEAEKDVFPYVCEQFGGVIDHGLGVRYWYVGNAGFTTDVVTTEICAQIEQSKDS